MTLNQRERVVVTGIGMVTPVGLTVGESWDRLLKGESGVAAVTQFDAARLPSRIAGEVKNFDPSRFINPKEVRRMARCTHLAIAAATEAIADAGLSSPVPEPERTGTAIGVGMGGMEWVLEQANVYFERGLRATSPFAITASLPNMPSHHVSVLAQARGPITTPVAACAAGAQAVGEATSVIRQGLADVMITGGVEGLIHEISMAGFCAMRALSTRNDEPTRASRPFDRDRDGFVMAEGAGVLVLESLTHARNRGAHIYAEILGYATSSDAFHISQPDPEARGAQNAMRWAVSDAGLSVESVDYINAHGTSTTLNDVTETLAIKQVFGEHAPKLAISSTKSITGHCIGGAGAIETIVCVKTLQTGWIHPTINLENPDPACDLDYVANVARNYPVQVAMNNAFGFGGQNACLVLRRWAG